MRIEHKVVGLIRYGALFVLSAACCPVLTGCVTTRAADDGLPQVEDPDPDHDSGGPQFCNPAGKTGAALTQCKQQNVALYQEFDDEAKKREPWFDFPPDGWSTSPELDGKFALPVTKDAEATAKLEAQSFAALTPTEVEFFTGKRVEFAGRAPYLVRGLLYFRETGAFKVFTQDQAILVQHDSMGLEVPHESRSALVVFLAAPPTHVYVQCGVLE